MVTSPIPSCRRGDELLFELLLEGDKLVFELLLEGDELLFEAYKVMVPLLQEGIGEVTIRESMHSKFVKLE